MEKLYIIGWGLSGGFGGVRYYEVIEAEAEDDATIRAWENACEYYEMYSGSNGLRSVSDIMGEEGCDEEEATGIYEEERESWLEYSAVPYSKEAEEKVKYYHYNNPFKHLTDVDQ